MPSTTSSTTPAKTLCKTKHTLKTQRSLKAPLMLRALLNTKRLTKTLMWGFLSMLVDCLDLQGLRVSKGQESASSINSLMPSLTQCQINSSYHQPVRLVRILKRQHLCPSTSTSTTVRFSHRMLLEALKLEIAPCFLHRRRIAIRLKSWSNQVCRATHPLSQTQFLPRKGTLMRYTIRGRTQQDASLHTTSVSLEKESDRRQKTG